MKPPKPGSWRQQLILLVGLTLVLALPLVVDLACSGPFRTPKTLLARALWAALAGLFLARPGWDAWGWPPVAVVVAGVIASLAAGQANLAVAPLALAALGWMGLRQLAAPQRRRLFLGMILGGVVQAILALAFADPATRPRSFAALEEAVGRFQVLGTMGNPGDVGVFLVLPALGALYMAVSQKRRSLWLLACLVQFVAIVASQTLSALAAFALGAFLLLILLLPPRKKWWAAGGAAAALALVILLVPSLRFRVAEAFRLPKELGFHWIASARGASWLSAWHMWQANPIFGVGLGHFPTHYFSYLGRDALAERGRVLGLKTGFGEAHNELLQYLAETGLVGLALLSASLFWAWRRGSPLENSLLPAAPVLAAMGLLALLQFPLHLAALAAQWLVVLALLLPPLKERAQRWRAGAWLGLGLLAATVVVSWSQWRAWRAVEAAQALVAALRQNPSNLGARVLAARAYENLQAKLSFLPGEVQAENVAGNLAREAGLWDQALAHFRRALALAERPELHFNLGVSLCALGQEEEGLRHLVQAVELNPAVLREVTDRVLAAKLRQKLTETGYFAAYPWAERFLLR
ncbi:MAG: O-antigen ligase family protein [Thermoanaerobaculaceae bacterium]